MPYVYVSVCLCGGVWVYVGVGVGGCVFVLAQSMQRYTDHIMWNKYKDKRI